MTLPHRVPATAALTLLRIFPSLNRDSADERSTCTDGSCFVESGEERLRAANFAAPALETETKPFEDLWRQNALGGFLVGREAVRRFAPRRRGTILFTGASASLRARPPFMGFASAKAALRAVAQGLAREFGPYGVHVAHIVIDGVIQGEYAAAKFPDYGRSKGENGLLAVDAIADAYWALHRQPASAWTHELDLRPFKEPF
jgi:NAD(P)-dependent dehydrogenase (short-subunit alcohol dehydrogenase family)